MRHCTNQRKGGDIAFGDVVCRFIDLPLAIKGGIVLEQDGSYSMYLNARHSLHTLQDAYAHELAHVEFEHLYNQINRLALPEDSADSIREPRPSSI